MYCVTFESTGFTAHLKHCENSLNEKQIESINSKFHDELKGAQLISGHISPDDNQLPYDARIFCVLKFAVSCSRQTEAENFEIDKIILSEIAEQIPQPVKNLKNMQPMELESDSWEVTDVESYNAPAQKLGNSLQVKRPGMR